MRNWQKTRTYRKFRNEAGELTFFIKVDGAYVEVSKDVYDVYAKSERQLEYMELDLKHNRVLQDAHGKAVRDADGQPLYLPEREVSLDKLMNEGWDYPSDDLCPDDAVQSRMDVVRLRFCLESLGKEDRALIDAIFFRRMTEREYAKQSGLSQQTVHARKRGILNKLKKYFE